MARTGLSSRVPSWQPEHPPLPVQGDTALPTPANLYSHKPQSGPTLTPSSLGFWVEMFVPMATTKKTGNPLPSTVTHTPSGYRSLSETSPESAATVPAVRGSQDQSRRKVFKLMPNTNQELWGQIPAAPAPPAHWVPDDPPGVGS